MSGIRAVAFTVVGGSVLRSPLICGNWKWVLEGGVCVCVSKPSGEEVSSHQTKPFSGRGTLCSHIKPLPSGGMAPASWALGQ